MYTVTIQCASLTELQALIAQLGGEAPKTTAPKSAPKATTSTPASPLEEKSEPADTTPEEAKADAAPSGNSQGLDAAAFAKIGMGFAKECGDQGAKLKAIWADFKTKDGGPITRLGEVQESDYDAFLEKIEEAKLA